MRVLVLVLSLLVLLLALSRMPAAGAAPLCEVRGEAHQLEHGGFKADSLWHVAHGERPTCGGEDSHARQGDDDHRDKKSRYCRKHWFC
ncbi:hypothetical protein SEA_KOKO_85 [Mycobacterium phage Koko]|uniref:RDF protein n=3 Tax=Gladiatorvirus TaxID=2948726 RepID=V5R6V8_9CAUD|nr:site-specific recombination directionality factor RDF [Mycobacterium phage Artemis2UCLA]YP_008859191.1 site-specific recombination directionality factor RDF [Mycobacterium phage Zaka]YP_009014573.1 site-specific recombination directionality factor RDF [Mycobacterium phage Blue7]YP_010061407.1 site-specific recombination directionality factor RDF [Mycobacterium phage Koko]ASZ74554.1 hypothetical protein SEA_WIKS_83 [Mycobacterium phage Wiks]AYD84898.1 hypothetical protein SEA_ZULU_85 [Mycoba